MDHGSHIFYLKWQTQQKFD